jgi:hypothetical protein
VKLLSRGITSIFLAFNSFGVSVAFSLFQSLVVAFKTTAGQRVRTEPNQRSAPQVADRAAFELDHMIRMAALQRLRKANQEHRTCSRQFDQPTDGRKNKRIVWLWSAKTKPFKPQTIAFGWIVGIVSYGPALTFEIIQAK